MSSTSNPGDELGPIDYVAVEFPAGAISGSGFEVLLDLADRGVIRILDLEFIAKDAEGNTRPVAVFENQWVLDVVTPGSPQARV